MLLETIGVVRSVFPFVKELFLWRDGAKVGEPITNKNLLRRKIATFVLILSLIFNYLLFTKVFALGREVVELKKEVVSLKGNSSAPITVTKKKEQEDKEHIVVLTHTVHSRSH